MTHDGEFASLSHTVARALLVAVPFGGSLDLLIEDLRKRMAARALDFTEQVEAVTGLERLESRLAQDPRLDAVFVTAVEASIRTGMDSKRRVLARAVVDMVNDDARLDESQLLIEALEELDVPHVRALKRLSDEWQAALAGDEHAADIARWGSSKAFPATPQVIRARLIRSGTASPSRSSLVRQAEPYRAEGITDFGLAVVETLVHEGLANDLGPDSPPAEGDGPSL